MTSEWYVRALPTVLIVLDLGASVVYTLAWNWRMALYWFAAAVLTSCVTF